MAEPLKKQFGLEIPRKIAVNISKVHSNFLSANFLEDVAQGYEPLGLMDRARRISDVLKKYLPADIARALRILSETWGPKLDRTEGFGMSPFYYLPYSFFVGTYGLNHWEESLQFQYELTQRFTSEFCVRPFLMKYPERTLAQLTQWVHDPSPHVRRWISEGIRPRLPWAPRIPSFQKNPLPVLKILERLKDDSELYVRRSVANNLNDIGKDHPGALLLTAKSWLKKASPGRRWIVRHALRSLVKKGDSQALALLGFNKSLNYSISTPRLDVNMVKGKKVIFVGFHLHNRGKDLAQFMVDMKIHYVKSRGHTQPKVFKMGQWKLGAQSTSAIRKKISLENMTTRKHFPGQHRVDVMVNGQTHFLGTFILPA